ncbi:MAG: hypothetical protein K0Q71_6180, partial [Thermomicrobiales bacterium]|nr:hypothetical protein [Thermomicrobiales bacterium]
AETGQFPAAIAFGEQALQLAALGNDRLTEARLRLRQGRLAMSRGDTTAALDHFTKGVALAEAMAQPAIQAQALSALAGAQAALNDPAATTTYRRALSQARTASDVASEAQAAFGLGQLLVREGARVEGSQMLQEAGAAARRMGARGQQLARRADDLLAGIGPLEPPPSRPPRRREAAAERAPRVETSEQTALDSSAESAVTLKVRTLPASTAGTFLCHDRTGSQAGSRPGNADRRTAVAPGNGW